MGSCSRPEVRMAVLFMRMETMGVGPRNVTIDRTAENHGGIPFDWCIGHTYLLLNTRTCIHFDPINRNHLGALNPGIDVGFSFCMGPS